MPDTEPSDPYLWLEDVLGDAALAWVRERNAQSQQVLQARPEYEPTRTRLLEIMNSKERIPQVSRRGEHFYNLWQDSTHKRGLWRRTTLAEYRKPEPAWESVLDLDALAAAEGENWVWAGAVGLPPAHARCLVCLSRGGADAVVVREFDTVAKAFVAGGFALAEAKSEVEWIDADTIYVGTDFGPGSLTNSGYPRVIKRWSRGTPLAAATPAFEAEPADMAAHVSVDATPGHERTLFVRAIDFYDRHYFLLDGSALRRLDVPGDSTIAFWNSAGDAADTLLPFSAASGCLRCCSRPHRRVRWRASRPRAATCSSTCSTTSPAGLRSGGARRAASCGARSPRRSP
ncbi:MAG: S9 family peptidase, partial [Burkholderiales bacterium]|nr:S9 family peptidase [Burkholderiales bacterium]